MNSWWEWIGLFFVLGLGILGWVFGYSQHREIRQGDSIYLPAFMKYLFGHPNLDGVYNIRGIYFQLFVAFFVIPFVLSDFGIIYRQQAFLLFALAMIIFPVLELLRYFSRR